MRISLFQFQDFALNFHNSNHLFRRLMHLGEAFNCGRRLNYDVDSLANYTASNASGNQTGGVNMTKSALLPDLDLHTVHRVFQGWGVPVYSSSRRSVNFTEFLNHMMTQRYLRPVLV